MKNEDVQSNLKEVANKFVNVKQYGAEHLLSDVIELMAPIGGITGFEVKSHKNLTLRNHTAHYHLPIKYEGHSNKLSKIGKKAYDFVDLLGEYLIKIGVSKKNLEYHLGKTCASKHHGNFEW